MQALNFIEGILLAHSELRDGGVDVQLRERRSNIAQTYSHEIRLDFMGPACHGLEFHAFQINILG